MNLQDEFLVLDTALSPTSARNLSAYIAQMQYEARVETLLQIWKAIPAMQASGSLESALRATILASEAGEVLKKTNRSN
jgi:hypothetical protein